ncbi:hypothetical protein [Aequorivita sediminis]|uniref:hypothetical protein n=1 Tax=Aequorivita sediminis TaxID=3073653 RepID=UPI0028ADA580|nr:hypothetical protein [Aequorivita sp. F6058]
MKTFNIIIIVLAHFCFVNVSSAQTFKDKDNKALEKIQAKPSLYNVVASQAVLPSNVRNSVFVQQIGNDNAAFSILKSNQSDVELFQIGNRNDVGLFISANKISEEVLQIGDNHSFTDISPNNNDIHATNVVQFGANQNLIRLGSQNSMSDKMLVTMKGNNQTVIIRSLKN